MPSNAMLIVLAQIAFLRQIILRGWIRGMASTDRSDWSIGCSMGKVDARAFYGVFEYLP